MAYLEYTEPNVCIDENLTTDDAGQLRLQPWAVPRLVADVRANSGGDGRVYPATTLPGKLLIDGRVAWRNDTPIDQRILIRITRGPRSWITSNPNAIQFRDRWTFAVDAEPAEPITTGIYNGHTGSAIDFGTNSVAEPQPGVEWMWTDTNSSDEWVPYPIEPGQHFRLRYRCYVWTPPPWSDNANKNQPRHEAHARWARLQLIAFGQQENVVTG
ncbi:hypothetical protein KEK_08132 [Mycolicibacterium thermoresistibile ATCC 19527]|uniref:DUF7172 domain-containing protein n=2 Tax=Mycolicibacterium thermoresistibile TaxID=1797 RepID=G7CF55_MYCT3|nr:hypothetical protein [Mycolicibacterium thermoresistibile]EHI13134.1 hypothetical protein KEK_08132 [Mycolicibacterium thermoresistibile ATCC 19527]MCV7187055.1 hypothetical protein [Mycolicibacterium thermoresistibile]GAT16308.1 putative uncharacterized protein [Mycolicibacterium thermoresistibile]SNW20322.1 Uncharacterised protein [Mycolicibacterium thermoresistibile]